MDILKYMRKGEDRAVVMLIKEGHRIGTIPSSNFVLHCPSRCSSNQGQSSLQLNLDVTILYVTNSLTKFFDYPFKPMCLQSLCNEGIATVNLDVMSSLH